MTRTPETSSQPLLSATERSLPIALLRAREALMERFRPVLSAWDLTEQQWRVLRVLQEAGVMDGRALAHRACILAPSLSRILKTLEQKALITMRKDPADGRRWLIRLTEEGEALIARIAPESARIYAEVEALVGGTEINEMLDRLESMTAALAQKD